MHYISFSTFFIPLLFMCSGTTNIGEATYGHKKNKKRKNKRTAIYNEERNIFLLWSFSILKDETV
jgi:hypothetical protein